MADRRNGLTWVDFVLFALALFGVYELLTHGFPGGPYVASAVIVVTAVVTTLFVLTGKDVYRWVFRYCTAFLLAMAFGNVSASDRLIDLPKRFELPLMLLGSSVPLLVAYVRSDRESAHRWMAFAMFLGLMVAMFSGSAGAGDEMVTWLQERFDWTLEQAQMSTRVFRKTVHVTFYALMFFSMARAAWQARLKWSVSFLAGLAWATGHAAFDETVQSFFDDRVGSLKDYLTDASGMALALVVCWLLWGRKGRS